MKNFKIRVAIAGMGVVGKKRRLYIEKNIYFEIKTNNFDFVKRGEGLDFTEFSNVKSTKLFLDFLFFSDSLSSGTISNKRTSISILARWQAIPEPIIPEPNTAIFFMFLIILKYFIVVYKLVDFT